MVPSDEMTDTVSRNSALPLERLRLISRFDDLHLSRIQRGVVYFLAPWSGPSVMYFRAMTAALSRMDSSSLDIYVVHIDCVPDEFMGASFRQRAPAGAGETLWIRDGTIVGAVVTYSRAEAATEFTRRTTDLLNQLGG
jgi:hypothetical protein